MRLRKRYHRGLQDRLEGVAKEDVAQSIETMTRPWVARILTDMPIEYDLLTESFGGDLDSHLAEALTTEFPPPSLDDRDARRQSIK